jgi:hypothetical protein
MGIQKVDEVKGMLLPKPHGQAPGTPGKADPIAGADRHTIDLDLLVVADHFVSGQPFPAR